MVGASPLTSQKQKRIREYYEQLYANQLNNLDLVDNFLERQTTKADPRRKLIT